MAYNQSRKRKIDNNQSVHDLISDLPLNIIHSILNLVPIRDAVRTCILSRQWRYKWATLPHLVFDYNCVDQTKSEDSQIECLKNMFTNALLLHQGPIQSFKLSYSLTSCPETDRWLLCLSRNEIRELCLTMNVFDDDKGWSRVHSSLYSCQELTHLKLNDCGLPPPPPTFKGFLCLRGLVLCGAMMSCNVFQSLIANSPLLENLRIESLDITDGELRITAPIFLKCLRSLVISEASVQVVESLIANSPLLENLTIAPLDIEEGELRNAAPINLKCLRSLVICEARVPYKVVESLIANSPLLENLTFEFLEITKAELRISAPMHLKCLSSLVICHSRVPCKVVESLIANSPLLEKFSFTSSDTDAKELRISAPNLRCLDLTGDIKEISVYAPLVVQVSVSLYNAGFTAEQQQSSLCNYAKFLSCLTNLERLVGHMGFTKCLSIGIESYDRSLVFHQLNSIHLHNISFNDKKQVAVVGHLIMGAPNLHEFKFSVYTPLLASKAPPMALYDSDFGWAPDFTMNKLRVIEAINVGGVSSELEFIKILLSRSTVLETITLPCYHLTAARASNLMEELLSYRRASPNASFSFEM